MLMPFLETSAQNVTYMTKTPTKMTKDQKYIACLETIQVHLSCSNTVTHRFMCRLHFKAGVLGRRVLSV